MREYTDMHLIKHVINCYEILSLSSNDGKWVVAVGTDLTTPTPKVVEVPAKPVEPKTLEKPTVVWHKNYVIEMVSFLPPIPPTPDTEVPQAELPQTGEHTRNAGLL